MVDRKSGSKQNLNTRRASGPFWGTPLSKE
nr:MAG TPA: hypothetical protein [Caudoviricetes sp.]